MRRSLALRSSLVLTLALSAWSSDAHAQSPAAAPVTTQSAAVTDGADSRPATMTFLGDTGIWYVPTAEVLGSGTWSVGGNRRGTNYVQGLSNVADFASAGAVGIGPRVEVFGSFLLDTRIDRDAPPVFVDEARQGGVIARYPRVSETWTGNNVGDLYLGTKVNLLSEYRRAPLALAIRGIVKLPTADSDAGTGTGKTDTMVDVVASKEFARFFDSAVFAGYEFRGIPSGFDGPRGSYRWGTGVTFPSRSPLRLSLEANGDLPTKYRETLTDASLVGLDGSRPPFESDIRNRTRGTVGLTYQAPAGFFMGTGLSWNAPRYWDWQVRVGYHGRGRTQPRAIAAVAPATEPSVAVARPPVVTPAPPAPPAVAPTPAPVTPSPVAAADARTTLMFEDVFFDLDGYTPRQESLAGLDAAVKTLQSNPTLNISVEGHTCDLATSEYNMGLGERRADAVKDYLLSRGIAAARLRTASFGEENPQHANLHETARRLNRRVALVVRVQP